MTPWYASPGSSVGDTIMPEADASAALWSTPATAVALIADYWGQHLWGRCKSNGFWQIAKKVHKIDRFDRLVPKKYLCVKKHNICSDPISADPIWSFPKYYSVV